MNKSDKFFDTIDKEMAVIIATAADDSVTMRMVSPVCFGTNILIFTYADSIKYRQLKQNPYCCIAADGCFMEAKAEFFGPTMLEENKAMREAYSAKFKGAFDENIEFGGIDAEFILLKPIKLKGWGFAGDVPTADNVPNEPFEIEF